MLSRVEARRAAFSFATTPDDGDRNRQSFFLFLSVSVLYRILSADLMQPHIPLRVRLWLLNGSLMTL